MFLEGLNDYDRFVMHTIILIRLLCIQSKAIFEISIIPGIIIFWRFRFSM